MGAAVITLTLQLGSSLSFGTFKALILLYQIDLQTSKLCSNWFCHGNTAISYPQCSLTFMRERYLHRCREQSFAIRAYAMSDVGIDVVSVHKLFSYRVVSTVPIDVVSSTEESHTVSQDSRVHCKVQMNG